MVAATVSAYSLWSPGKVVTDGRFDRMYNGIWLQHGWLGDDAWFARNKRDVQPFRDSGKIRALAELFADHPITDVFPHLCPCHDTAIDLQKNYIGLMRARTQAVLAWTGRTPVLLGLPAYQDEGVGYHNPEVENLENVLLGVDAALAGYATPPASYQGIAVHCEWEMDPEKWRIVTNRFLSRKPKD